jgi:hypothetical protein
LDWGRWIRMIFRRMTRRMVECGKWIVVVIVTAYLNIGKSWM